MPSLSKRSLMLFKRSYFITVAFTAVAAHAHARSVMAESPRFTTRITTSGTSAFFRAVV